MLPILGAQIEQELGDRDRWLVPNRVYHMNFRWDDIEKREGVYTFPAWAFDNIARLDAKLGKDNYRLIIGVKCTPVIYSIPPHARNSPPAPQHYDKFAHFCASVCDVFKPWGIELWNEPEFPAGGDNQEYYGGFGADGFRYGDMVRVVYDYLTLKQTGTKVIAGASYGLTNRDGALVFLRLAVEAGMKSDYWSWHGYIWDWEVWTNLDKFRDLLRFSWDAQEIYNVPQILSEFAVIRKNPREREASRIRQAELMQYMIIHREITNIECMLWYMLADNGWYHCSMVMGDTQYPVYQVWRQPQWTTTV
ncbi:hypothetical protein [Candidatus Magnetobacterium casense]|uniref:Uncharacterized protein n=1 Tax=Candidatus Magnetobacterium casense TaxID=1455061 RepID=A0ABS6S486_9BACT|nr:hypothetical protein [Candidatus Magnetobacterium casensis]MBV6343664.1 hypothetical protein [Candidatus Magnetobacterium casensis]